MSRAQFETYEPAVLRLKIFAIKSLIQAEGVGTLLSPPDLLIRLLWDVALLLLQCFDAVLVIVFRNVVIHGSEVGFIGRPILLLHFLRSFPLLGSVISSRFHLTKLFRFVGLLRYFWRVSWKSLIGGLVTKDVIGGEAKVVSLGVPTSCADHFVLMLEG